MTETIDLGRPLWECPECGRGIYADHNLSEKNFDSHVRSCPEQQAKKYIARTKRMNKRMGRSDGAIPMLGQIGFPFDGIPRVVGRSVLTDAKRVIH